MENPNEPKKPDSDREIIRMLVRHSIDMFTNGITVGMMIAKIENLGSTEGLSLDQPKDQQVTVSAEEFSEKIRQVRDAAFNAGWDALAERIKSSLNRIIDFSEIRG